LICEGFASWPSTVTTVSGAIRSVVICPSLAWILIERFQTFWTVPETTVSLGWPLRSPALELLIEPLEPDIEPELDPVAMSLLPVEPDAVPPPVEAAPVELRSEVLVLSVPEVAAPPWGPFGLAAFELSTEPLPVEPDAVPLSVEAEPVELRSEVLLLSVPEADAPPWGPFGLAAFELSTEPLL